MTTWRPTTDFEEEIVNLQPDHDFIYGALSESGPQPAYPRPQAHIEYANNLKKQSKQQQELYEATGRMNEKLHVISQVQRIAGTKPLGEQPTINDWDSDKNVEKETIGMMRHCGLGPSVEEPLNNKVTIASYPVENNMHVMKNGRKKIPLFFDDNIFELKPKVSNTSSGFESATSSSNSNDSNVNKDDSLPSNATDTSFETTASSFNNSSSFYTGKNDSPDSNISMTPYKKAQLERETLLLKAERMRQYDKLQEETASLSISNHTQGNDSFKTAKENNSWRPYAYEDDDNFNKNSLNWPSLNNSDFIPSNPRYSRKSSISSSSVDSFNTSQDLYSSNCSNISETSDNSFQQTRSKNFLQRFMKPEYIDTSDTTLSSDGSFASSSISSSPSTYADMAKTSSPAAASPTSRQSATRKTTNILQHIPRFYTTREVYERKRRVQ